jgi:hypothetical protein
MPFAGTLHGAGRVVREFLLWSHYDLFPEEYSLAPSGYKGGSG